MNKKSIGALLLSAALLVGGTGATFAYFTNSATADEQTITMGNVTVAFDANNGTPWSVLQRNVSVMNFPSFQLGSAPTTADLDEIVYGADNKSIGNLAPGDVVVKSFTLRNTGSLDAKVKLSLVDLKKNGVAIGSTSLEGFRIQAYRLNTDGSQGQEVQLGLFPDYVTLDAHQHESVVIYVGACIDNKMTNGGKDESLSFKLKADATQWNNSGWDEAGN